MNAGDDYYKAVLQNPGVQLYLKQHPTDIAMAEKDEFDNTTDTYRSLFDHPGFKYYIEQHAAELDDMSLGTPYMMI